MRFPIVCRNCGCPIDDIGDAFIKAKKDLEEKGEKKFGDLLDKFGITKECCRTSLLTSINFASLIS